MQSLNESFQRIATATIHYYIILCTYLTEWTQVRKCLTFQNIDSTKGVLRRFLSLAFATAAMLRNTLKRTPRHLLRKRQRNQTTQLTATNRLRKDHNKSQQCHDSVMSPWIHQYRGKSRSPSTKPSRRS